MQEHVQSSVETLGFVAYSICTNSLARDPAVAAGAGRCGSRHASKIETW
jgi:hypothetical protein